MAWAAENDKSLNALENRLAAMVCEGCSTGRDSVIAALIEASESDSEVLISSLLRFVLRAVRF